MIKNKPQILLVSVFLLFGLFVSFVSAANSCVLSVNLVNQDPYPAIPGEYVELVFQVDGTDNSDCNGAIFELVPSYPFSLDDNSSSAKTLNASTWVSGYKTEWMIPYKLRVDEDAFDGEYEIEIKYGQNDDFVFVKNIGNISVQDSRTSFDAVIQDSTDSEISIAIANVGKYTANSVIVRIPEQDNFESSGTDGQMVGNLDSGDYTIVSFEVTQKMQMGFKEQSENETSLDANVLQVDIYYTDALGERRVVNLDLKMSSSSNNSFASMGELSEEDMENFPGMGGMGMRTQTSFWSSWYVKGAIFFILLILIIYLFKKYPKKINKLYLNLKQRFHKKDKNKSKKISTSIPDWMKDSTRSRREK